MCIHIFFLFFLQTNTYQGIVITNGQQSYALFVYQCNRMGWSGNATIGFSAAGNFYQNHHLSGTPNAKTIACMNLTGSVRSNIVYQLSKCLGIASNWKYSCYASISLQDDNYLPFLDLGYTSGVTKKYLEGADNTSSVAINIPGGLTLGTDNQTLVHVSIWL